MPSFNILKLKLINNPTLQSDSFKYDNNYSLWIGKIFSIDFISTITASSTIKS